jgi:DNA repair exonuclease SbcCD nuclease subunit
VLIAGNHDHPRKLDALATLLESLGIHVRRPPPSTSSRLAHRAGLFLEESCVRDGGTRWTPLSTR